MKQKNILIIVCFLAVSIFLSAVQNEYYFRFRVIDQSEISKITRIISIDNFKDGYFYAYANDEQLQKFYDYGYFCEFITHPGRLYKPKMTSETENGRIWTAYPTYDAFITIMNQFALAFPDICSVESLGNTVNGREILMAKISDNVNIDETEPEFLYVGTMHGDETTGYICLLNLIELLLTDYGNDPRITNIVDNMEIWISPLQNPDGTYHGGNNTVFDARRYNANGVDLNRNFPCPLEGPHPDGNAWQPETIIMMDFADEHHIAMGANFHGGTEVINYPWDFWSTLHADDDWYIYTSQIYANTAQANSPAGYMSGYNNGITNGFAWYETHGGRQDYMNYFQHAREVTMEISDTKILPEALLEDYWNYNKESMLLYIEEGLYGIHGTVKNISGLPLEAKIEVLNHDIDNSHIYSHPDLGDFHRYLAENIYDLQASAYGYLPQTVETVPVINSNHYEIDFILQEAPDYTISGQITNGNTNSPIFNAMIEFLDTPLDPVFTDVNGNYTIDNVYEGVYQVYISADEYSNLMLEVTVDENNAIHDFELFWSEVEDFETGNFDNFPWAFNGNAIWTIDSEIMYEGDYSAKSGEIGNNQQTILYINLNVTAHGEISFYSKVSSEDGYDFLEFYIDNNLIEKWSGEIDWHETHYSVVPGNHEFKWIYVKDHNVSSGEDCAWIDLVAFPCTIQMHATNLPQPEFVNLVGNHPNPFNPCTTISFEINSLNDVDTKLEIYNIKGQKVITLLDSKLPSGNYQIVWNGTDSNLKPVASGIYFYDLRNNKNKNTKKMVLLK